MDMEEAAALETGTTGFPGAGDDSGARGREIGELEFLVGTACSRAINLLMRSDRDPGELADELAFLGEKATRLSILLRAAEATGATEGTGDASTGGAAGAATGDRATDLP